MLSIPVQLACGHADYLVKVGTTIFGIFLTEADRTMHKLLTMCSALTTRICLTNMLTAKEFSLQVRVVEASVRRILNQLQLKKVYDRWVPKMLPAAHKETRKTVCSELN